MLRPAKFLSLYRLYLVVVVALWFSFTYYVFPRLRGAGGFPHDGSPVILLLVSR